MAAGLIMTLFMVTLIVKILLEVFVKDPSIGRVLTPIFIFLTFGLQMWLVMSETKANCGKIQLMPTLTYGLLYWILIFGSIYAILLIAPGWKQPFSNFFGYGIVSFMGVNDIFNRMLIDEKIASKDTKLNMIVERIYKNSSLLINTLTPSNFNESLKDLRSILRTRSKTFTNDVKQLGHLVFLKDKIAENIWLGLAGWLSLSYASMLAADSKCTISNDQMAEHIKEYETTSLQQINENNETEKKKQGIMVVKR